VIWGNMMPAFTFMVSFSLPFMLEHRRARGFTFGQTLRGVVARVIRMALLGRSFTRFKPDITTPTRSKR
jgi:hypothetical protein